MRLILAASGIFLSLLVTGCTASVEGGVTDPEAAEQAVAELFADNGERVLMQASAEDILDQQALDSTAGRSDIRCKRCVRRQRREERFQTPGKGRPVPQSGFETSEGHVALMVTE